MLVNLRPSLEIICCVVGLCCLIASAFYLARGVVGLLGAGRNER